MGDLKIMMVSKNLKEHWKHSVMVLQEVELFCSEEKSSPYWDKATDAQTLQKFNVQIFSNFWLKENFKNVPFQ